MTLLCGTTLMAGKKDDGKIWQDAELAAKEDPDFLIQGEYGSEKEGTFKFGVQVIAMGDGMFDAYVLEDGLPGAGWDKAKLRSPMNGQYEGKTVVLSGDMFTAVITDGTCHLRKGPDEIAELPRILRKSPTLGAKPPKEAIVLFDGSNTDEWEGGRLENGLLRHGTTSKRTFGSHHIHLEFMTPYKPKARGQGRGNSGVYHQGRFETQVLDSFGLEGRINETGGIYSIAPPKLNMCFPPLSWQTYDVDFTEAEYDDGKKVKNARMTVRLNGVVVHDDVELTHSTTASKLKEGPEPGPVYIQDHGNPVYYRNIWVVEK
jgi:hypothetical protein